MVLARGGNVNRILSDAHANGVDVHQLNCTYYAALGEDDERYLAARAIQLFAKGIPQLYYVGLLGGLERPGGGRADRRGPGGEPARLHLAGDQAALERRWSVASSS